MLANNLSDRLLFDHNKSDRRNKMIELKGSEKQIAWATRIRMAFFIGFDYIAKKIVNEMPQEQQSMMQKGINIFRNIFENESSSAWWIENRNLNFDTVEAFRNEFRLRANLNPELRAWFSELKTMQAAQAEKPQQVVAVKKEETQLSSKEIAKKDYEFKIALKDALVEVATNDEMNQIHKALESWIIARENASEKKTTILLELGKISEKDLNKKFRNTLIDLLVKFGYAEKQHADMPINRMSREEKDLFTRSFYN